MAPIEAATASATERTSEMESVSDSSSEAGDDRNSFLFDMDGEESYELQDRGAGKSKKPHDEGRVSLHHEEFAASPLDPSRRFSDSTAASFQLYTPDEEQAVVRKFDRRLVLFLALCYMLSFLDRSSAYRPILDGYVLPFMHAVSITYDGIRYRQCADLRHGGRSSD